MINKILKSFFLLAVFLIAPSFTWAAPSITSAIPVTTFSHGVVVNISGSGFGTKTQAAPLQWDPVDGMYSGLSNGDPIPVGSGHPWVGLQQGGNVYYKTTNPRGKNIAHYSNQWSTMYGKAAVQGIDYPSASNKFYLTWWTWIGGEDENPAESSNKFIRLTADNGWDTGNDDAYGFFFDSTHAQSFNMNGGYYTDAWGAGPDIGAWTRFEVIVDNDNIPQSPRIIVNYNGQTQYDSYPGQVNYLGEASYCSGGDNCINTSMGRPLTSVGMIGYDDSGATGANPTPVVDFGEIYIDNTLARVEICNASTKAASTHCEIQIPQGTNTWTDNNQANGAQLQIKVNQGAFADGSSQYLYVVDANGNPNVNGFPITFGAGSSDATAPAAPSGLTVN